MSEEHPESPATPVLEHADIPVPLSKVPAVFFPHGGATVATLRTAIREGHLKAEMIGGKYFVTGGDIHRWRDHCRAQSEHRAAERRKLQENRGDRVATAALRTALQERLRQAKFKAGGTA